MSQDKSKEFSLEGLDDPELELSGENPDVSALEEEGFELNLSDDIEDLDLSDDQSAEPKDAAGNLNEFSLTNVKMEIPLQEELSANESDESLNLNEIDLGEDSDKFDMGDSSLQFDASAMDELNMAEADSLDADLSDSDISDDFINTGLGDSDIGDMSSDMDPSSDMSLDDLSDIKLFDDMPDEVDSDISDPLKDYSSPKLQLDSEDLTEDVKAKLKEIDAIMEEDATNGAFNLSDSGINDYSEDESIVGDVNLDNLRLDDSTSPDIKVDSSTQNKKKKKTETTAHAGASASIEEISQAYTGEMERTQATIANLRADRDELLKRIDHLEEEKLLSHRNTLTMRAELDEKKIELTIIRKKLNEEIHELKDKVRLFEEKVMILEEKNKHLLQEIDKAGQKNKIDVKRVMLRERELEQKLELLKADAETQIRNRDLKILELKRRIDAMEFDMESMSQQEKKTLESRFELEDKLDKAIRTLRTAISNLEEEGGRSATLDAIKKNVEM